MAKITISQLQITDAASIEELTNAELDATKGGLTAVLAPVLNSQNLAILGQADTSCSTNTVGTNILQNVLGIIL